MGEQPLGAISKELVEEVMKLKAQLREVSQWLDKLEEKRASVSPEVYKRVREDYEGRLRRIEERMESLRRSEEKRIRALTAEWERALEEARQAEEEAKLRFEVGEIGRDELERRLEAIESKKKQFRAQLEEIRNLFGEEAVSDVPVSVATEEVEEKVEEVEEVTVVASEPAPPEPVAPEPVPPPPPSKYPEVTAAIDVGKVEDKPKPPPLEVTAPISVREAVPAGETVLIKWPRLETVGPRKEEYSLSSARARIGSAKDNDVVLEGNKVDPYHAEISLAPEGGYAIRDLASKAGVLVNGVPVTEKLLKEGDRVRIGDVELIFHES